MNSIAILYGGNLSPEAYKPLYNGKSSFELSLEQAKKFPGVTNTVIIENSHTNRSLLDKIAELQAGYDFAYFAFADSPFLDPILTGKMAERHTRYKAEYTYADGWPFGVTPEILAPGTAAILSKILEKDDFAQENAGKEIIFSVLQKDINAFDIETEISETDLRCHRLYLCADSKRNLLLLNNFITANNGTIPSSSDIESIIKNKPEILRTLPSFYPVQVCGGCPENISTSSECKHCPYPAITKTEKLNNFMSLKDFKNLIEKITGFSGDAVIDLSLWGEISLHPEKFKLIEAVLNKKELSLVIETSGIGWKENDMESISSLNNSDGRLSWIISVGNQESETFAKKLLEVFPKNCFVQTIRIKGSEDETEKFYRFWKDASPCGEKNIIIQKYDDFCGRLEKKQASDISPVLRQPCWHIMRDMPVLIDGTVVLCRSELEKNRVLGNAFNDSPENIWKNGGKYYIEHCNRNYTELCKNCDEYYTFNF